MFIWGLKSVARMNAGRLTLIYGPQQIWSDLGPAASQKAAGLPSAYAGPAGQPAFLPH